MKIKHWLGAVLLCIATIAYPQHTFTVKANKPIADIAPTMWGIFFEDINLGADGGIYAELVKNRSFEFNNPLMGWSIKMSDKTDPQVAGMNPPVLVVNRKENTANPRYIHVTVDNAVKGDFLLSNEGFRGMGIKKDIRYDFSVMYHQATAGVKLHIALSDSAGKELGSTTITPAETGIGWHKATAAFTANATVMKGRMNIWFEGNGAIDLDMVSLFPSDTWKGRPGGMRADMVQKLADLKPGFIRFPGGCIVEGYDLEHRYQWKKTVGPIEERQLIINRWNTEFAHRPAPDYFQTFGLGFFEYFQLAEDIGAAPLPIINCGMACQFNSKEVVPMDDLQPYIQDALDLIEFANGDVASTWGKIRAAMGHPAPFNLTMMGIGNENWGPQYLERLKAFTKAIKEKYPAIKLINSSGFAPDGALFNYLDKELRNMQADFIDEHYYRSPEWFYANVKRYDTFPRNNTKIFAGEYASHVDGTKGDQKNCWLSAISEAAFMTGLERNAAVVNMASYAPLFAHVDGWQWTPDLIWVNNLESYGTPDYYVQQMYTLNKGNKVVPVTLNNEVVAGQDSLYATAAIDTVKREVIIKVVNASAKPQENTIILEGAGKTAAQATVISMQSNDLLAVNSFTSPTNISPKTSVMNVKGKKISVKAAPYSFTIFRIGMQ